MSKQPRYKVHILAVATASKVVGVIECNSFEEYKNKFKEFADNWDGEGAPFANISNDFDMGDAELEEISEDDFKYCEIRK